MDCGSDALMMEHCGDICQGSNTLSNLIVFNVIVFSVIVFIVIVFNVIVFNVIKSASKPQIFKVAMTETVLSFDRF